MILSGLSLQPYTDLMPKVSKLKLPPLDAGDET